VSAFVDSFCGIVDACCGTLGKTVRPDSCRTVFYGDGRPYGPMSDVIPPRVANYNPVAGAECLDGLRQPVAGGGSCFPLSADRADACWRAFDAHYGSLGPGSPCATSSDCSAPEGGASTCQDVTDGSLLKVCLWHTYGKAGDPCNGDESSDGIGLFRDYVANPADIICRQHDGLHCDTSSLTCQPLGEPGARCTDTSHCGSGFCKGLTADTPGACLAGAKVGEDCHESPCERGTYCEAPCGAACGAAYQCVAEHGPGSPCTVNEECTESHCLDGTCTAITDFQFGWLAGSGCNL
jgi:hypothetical protein